MLRILCFAAFFIQACFPANLAISTYFKSGFTPTAITSDAQGNILIAGAAVIDPVAETTGAAVVKINPSATQYLYLTYLDSAAADQVTGIAVDSAGNAYVSGWTVNPNFEAVGGGSLGTAPTGSQDPRSFVTKLGPDGAVLFSVLIGGSVASQARGIAVTPQGQILVSGLALANGFPSTSGAYSVATSNGNWFLMELDPTASKMIFSATGIGGSSIAFDSTGNIYLAGSSTGTNYPTTPGAYQTTFVQGSYCFGFCQIGFPGVLQHVTKVDPAASKLIYSTGLNGQTGQIGNVANTGLAVDAAGDVFVTGMLLEAEYPFTVKAASTEYPGSYLSKLDPTGSSLLFSVPVGGGGVALDSSGSVYVGGIVSGYRLVLNGPGDETGPVAPPAIFSWVPQQCWSNNIVATNEAYVMKVDPASGNTLDGQWIDGSGPIAVGITIAGGNVWLTGSTPAADVPLTPLALLPANLGSGFATGAFLSAVNFSASSSSGTPNIACVLDAANLEHVRAVGPNQAISIFGENLGPATGVAAPDGTDPSVAGVTVTINAEPAPLLYVSSTQINVLVPMPALLPTNNFPASLTVGVNVNGANSIERQFPFVLSNPNLFANLSATVGTCVGTIITNTGFQPLAQNADGSLNSCANPAKLGSTVSFFVDGAGGNTSVPLALVASIGECSATAYGSVIDGFVYKMETPLPSSLKSCAVSSVSTPGAVFSLPVTFSSNDTPVGPVYVIPPPLQGPIVDFTASQSMTMILWVTQ
jgi:uncharacterized protein (TIGR03437 family)